MAFSGVSSDQLAHYRLTPAAQPPPGVVADFERPSPLVVTTIIVVAIVFLLTTSFVALRIYTRHFFQKQLWWDDCKSLLPKPASTALLIFSRLLDTSFGMLALRFDTGYGADFAPLQSYFWSQAVYLRVDQMSSIEVACILGTSTRTKPSSWYSTPSSSRSSMRSASLSQSSPSFSKYDVYLRQPEPETRLYTTQSPHSYSRIPCSTLRRLFSPSYDARHELEFGIRTFQEIASLKMLTFALCQARPWMFSLIAWFCSCRWTGSGACR